MKKLNVAIIGCGRVSICYEDAFLRLSDYVHVSCAVDTCLDKAEFYKNRAGGHIHSVSSGFVLLQDETLSSFHRMITRNKSSST